MAAAVGKALKGLGKAFLKRRATIGGLKAASRRGTPTKAGLVARRAALRGETTAEKYRKALGPTPKAVKKKPIISKADTTEGIVGAGMGAVIGYTLGKKIEKKEAKAKETKEKLKKSVKEHKKKTKEKKEKQKK